MLKTASSTASPSGAASPLGVLRVAALAAAVAFTPAVGAAESAEPAASAHEHHHAGTKTELGASAAFAPDGSLHAVAKRGEHVVLYRSADEGRSWSDPVPVNAAPEAISADGENRPKIAFAADGTPLVSWTHPLAKRYTGEIRLARGDGAGRFAAPVTVHRDRSEITHRFESMVVAPDGRVVLAWIDKRDLEAATKTGTDYRGAAVYAAVSNDGGRSFRPEVKVADHSCECCRIGAAIDADGAPLLMWRHVFAPNERDHAIARLDRDGRPQQVVRATFDHWRVDACPHHGPSLAVAPDGTRHAVWFDERDGEGRVFYGRLRAGRVDGQRAVGGERAAHADIATSGRQVALAWTEFDGERTRLRAEVSEDGGKHFRAVELAETTGAAGEPLVLVHGGRFFAFWQTADEGLRTYPLVTAMETSK